jgi:hypothetical protein
MRLVQARTNPLPGFAVKFWPDGLGYLVLGGPPLELHLQVQHLVFETQFQLLQPDFLHFFVFGEVPLLGERFQPLGKLRMLLNQSPEFFMTGQEMVSRSQHPC